MGEEECGSFIFFNSSDSIINKLGNFYLQDRIVSWSLPVVTCV